VTIYDFFKDTFEEFLRQLEEIERGYAEANDQARQIRSRSGELHQEQIEFEERKLNGFRSQVENARSVVYVELSSHFDSTKGNFVKEISELANHNESFQIYMKAALGKFDDQNPNMAEVIRNFKMAIAELHEMKKITDKLADDEE